MQLQVHAKKAIFARTGGSALLYVERMSSQLGPSHTLGRHFESGVLCSELRRTACFDFSLRLVLRRYASRTPEFTGPQRSIILFEGIPRIQWTNYGDCRCVRVCLAGLLVWSSFGRMPAPLRSLARLSRKQLLLVALVSAFAKEA